MMQNSEDKYIIILENSSERFFLQKKYAVHIYLVIKTGNLDNFLPIRFLSRF